MATEQVEEPEAGEVRLQQGVVEIFDGNRWLPYTDDGEPAAFHAVFRDGGE